MAEAFILHQENKNKEKRTKKGIITNKNYLQNFPKHLIHSHEKEGNRIRIKNINKSMINIKILIMFILICPALSDLALSMNIQLNDNIFHPILNNSDLKQPTQILINGTNAKDLPAFQNKTEDNFLKIKYLGEKNDK